MADISKIKVPDGTSYNIKDNSQTRSDHNHYDSDTIPFVHKLYESTSYYATANDWENASWYFMSVKPDEWYKPWRVKLKVHTYCPAYSGYHSYTWSTLCGRESGAIGADWNEKYNTAHNYNSTVLLGFCTVLLNQHGGVEAREYWEKPVEPGPEPEPTPDPEEE